MDRNFDFLYGGENEFSQFGIEGVKVDNVGKGAVGFEGVLHFVSFHDAPIFGQTKIADKTQSSFGFLLILNNQSSLSECVNLFG